MGPRRSQSCPPALPPRDFTTASVPQQPRPSTPVPSSDDGSIGFTSSFDSATHDGENVLRTPREDMARPYLNPSATEFVPPASLLKRVAKRADAKRKLMEMGLISSEIASPIASSDTTVTTPVTSNEADPVDSDDDSVEVVWCESQKRPPLPHPQPMLPGYESNPWGVPPHIAAMHHAWAAQYAAGPAYQMPVGIPVVQSQPVVKTPTTPLQPVPQKNGSGRHRGGGRARHRAPVMPAVAQPSMGVPIRGPRA